jgi:photosynthetic reaction center cytochrome c subunit
VNTLWIEPTTVALPDYRLGPLGDPAKVNCTTCHQGVFKPLYGANMLEDFPSLAEPNPVDRETLEPGLADPAVSMQIGRELETAAADAQAEAPAAEADGDAQATPPAADATEGDAEAAAAPAEEGTDAADAGTDAAEAPAADDGTETAQ